MHGCESRYQSGSSTGHHLACQPMSDTSPVAMEVAAARDVSHQLRQMALVKFMEARVEAFTALHNLHEVYTRLFAEDRVRPVVKASLLLSWVRMDLPTALRFYHQLHAAPVTQWAHLFATQQGRSIQAYGRPSTLFTDNDTVDCLLRGLLARIEEEAIPEVVIWQEVADAVTQSPQFAAGRSAGSSPSALSVPFHSPPPSLCPSDSALFDTGRFWDGLTHADGPQDTKELATDFGRDLDPFAKLWEAPPPPLPPPPGIQAMECYSEGSAHPDGARTSGASSDAKGTKRSLSLDRAAGMRDDEPRRAERTPTGTESPKAQPGADDNEPSLPQGAAGTAEAGWQGDMVMLLEAADGPDWHMDAVEVSPLLTSSRLDRRPRDGAGAGDLPTSMGRAVEPDPLLVYFPGPVRTWEHWPTWGRKSPTETFGSSWDDTLAKVRCLLNPLRPLPNIPAAERQQRVFHLWSPSGWGAEYAVLDVGAVQLLLFSTPKKWLAGLRYIEDNPSDSTYRHFRTRVGFADRNWNKMLKQAIFANNAIAATTGAWQPDPLPPPVSRGLGKGAGKGSRNGKW